MLDSVIIVSKNMAFQAINMKEAAAMCANTDNLTLGVLTDLVFDPFLIHFSFVFVDIDHQK